MHISTRGADCTCEVGWGGVFVLLFVLANNSPFTCWLFSRHQESLDHTNPLVLILDTFHHVGGVPGKLCLPRGANISGFQFLVPNYI